VKGAAFGALVQLEVVEEVIDDLPIVEADLRQLAPAGAEHLVDVAGLTRIAVVDFAVLRVAGLGPRRGFHPPERGLVAVHPGELRRRPEGPAEMFISYKGKTPVVAPSAFVAPTAVLIGDVEIGANSSVWFGAVLRGDNGPIRVGERTSIQDNAVVHVSEGSKTVLGNDVTVGHSASMEDCTIDDGALVGTNAVVLNGAYVGKRVLVAAGSVVGSNAHIPEGVLVAGAPAEIKKKLAGTALAWVEHAAPEYVALSRSYLHHGIGDPEVHEIAEYKVT
jgi:carbonic anhydrase/acetyltransferase-like protein (isoleucine patch superfamily)